MKLTRQGRMPECGQALVFVMLTAAVSLTVLAGLMGRTATNSALNDRSNRYLAAVSAAEAATEKTLASLMWDYSRSGAGTVAARLNAYPALTPQVWEHPRWAHYQFEDLSGSPDQLSVRQIRPWTAGAPLISQYAGLSGFASEFRVSAVAREAGDANPVAAMVEQQFQLATIPIFQFAIFYNMDLEINPGPNMTVSGRVHSNGDIYTQPQAKLLFNDNVTAAGEIVHDKKPEDPLIRSIGTITYEGEHDSGVNSLNLPIGTDNSPENVRQIIQSPPSTELSSSAMGQQRLYNQADLVVVVKNGSSAQSPPVIQISGQKALGMSPQVVQGFMQFTNVSFYNKREEKTVKAVQLDVAAMQTRVSGINSIYVDDVRAQSSSSEPGLRVINGQTLPSGGLTVATRLPLYVKGDYNAPTSALGTADTSQTRPAALIADAITVLSGAWNDGNSTKALGSRIANNTTVNAAFLTGIVPTSTENGYSGGVENFPRFIEDWNNKVLTYNGSMVAMYESAIATGDWRGTGSSIGIYNPPKRNWSFDRNFLDPTRLPPLTPQARTAIRGEWVMGSAPHPGT